MHALPSPDVRRRFAVPGFLLGIALLAVGGLAILPAAAPAQDVLVAQSAASAQVDVSPRVMLDRPAVRPRVQPAPKRTVVKKAPATRPAKRASRKRVAADLGSGGYFCPVAGRRSFSDDWGDARAGHRHQGNDILAAYGTPLVAVTAGVVKTAYSSSGGISLYLRGVDGDEYFYAHNSRNVATTGERVAAGEVIAYVGTSGNARGGPAHVHFERHPNGGSAVDPYPFLVRACR